MPPGLLAEIRELGERGVAGAEIARAFEARGERDAPSLRTIQDILREQRASDASEAWSVATAGSSEIPVALEVLRAVVEETEGRRTSLTRAEVDWIVRVRTAAPDLPAWDVYRLARLYLRLCVRGESTASLDAYLAFGGWRTESQNLYHAAIAAEWVPEPPREIVRPITRSEIDELADRWSSKWVDGDLQGTAEMRDAGLSDGEIRGVLVRAIRGALLGERDPDDLAVLPFDSIPQGTPLREALARGYRDLVATVILADRKSRARGFSAGSEELQKARRDMVDGMVERGRSAEEAEAIAAGLQIFARETALEEAVDSIRAALPAPIRPWLDEALRAERRRREREDGK